MKEWYGWLLIDLAKKMDKIEDNNPDYRNSRTWQKYRRQQDLIYNKIRKENEVQKDVEF